MESGLPSQQRVECRRCCFQPGRPGVAMLFGIVVPGLHIEVDGQQSNRQANSLRLARNGTGWRRFQGVERHTRPEFLKNLPLS